MARLLIINADDLGYDPSVTRGILQSMREGVVSSATFMVNTPFSADAAALAQGLSLGLHLNLARNRPMWAGFPAEHLRDGELSEPLAPSLPSEVVRTEALAQLAHFEFLLGKSPTHLDVHKHLHRFPNVLNGVIEAATRWGIPVRSIDRQMRAALHTSGVRTNAEFIGEAGGEAYWTLARLDEALGKLEDGVTELMCHPGYTPAQVKSGYSAQREVELATFLSPEARRLLASHEVTVVDFRAVTQP